MNGHSMGFDYHMAKHGFDVYVPDTIIMVDTSSIDFKLITKQMNKNYHAVSRMKRVVKGTHWNFDPTFDWLSPLNAPSFERMPQPDWEWRNKCRLIL